MKSVHACDFLPDGTRLWATEGANVSLIGTVSVRYDGRVTFWGGRADGQETAGLMDGEKLEVQGHAYNLAQLQARWDAYLLGKASVDDVFTAWLPVTRLARTSEADRERIVEWIQRDPVGFGRHVHGIGPTQKTKASVTNGI